MSINETIVSWCFVTVLLGVWENGVERQSKVCALEWLTGSCRGRASPNPTSRARQCPFNWRPEHVSQVVACPLGCSYWPAHVGTDTSARQMDLYGHKYDLSCRGGWRGLKFSSCCCYILGKGFSLCQLLSKEPCLEHSETPWASCSWHVLMDSESFPGDKQCFCFTKRMQRHGQMVVIQKSPVLLISNVQLFPTHYL